MARGRKRKVRIKRPRRKNVRAAQPSNPPSINVNPWRRITVSSTATADGQLQAVNAKSLIKLATAQVSTPVPDNMFSLIQIHRVRVWNMGNGPLVLKPYSLVRPVQPAWVDEPLTTLEDYPGKMSYAKCQYSWPKMHQKAIFNDDSNVHNSDLSSSAVIFEYKANPKDRLVFHTFVSWKMSTSATFLNCSEMTVRDSSGLERRVNLTDSAVRVDAQSPGSIVEGFEDLGFSPSPAK